MPKSENVNELIELDSSNDGCKIYVSPDVIGAIEDLPETGRCTARTRIDTKDSRQFYVVKQPAKYIVLRAEEIRVRHHLQQSKIENQEVIKQAKRAIQALLPLAKCDTQEDCNVITFAGETVALLDQTEQPEPVRQNDGAGESIPLDVQREAIDVTRSILK